MPGNEQWTRVVVLTAPASGGGNGQSLDEPLKSMFAARDWFAIVHHDPHLAMAELCLRERAQAARAGWGLQPMEKIALVIVESSDWKSHWDQVRELIAAVQSYIPSATIWSANDDSITPLNISAAIKPAPRGSAPPIAPNSINRPMPDLSPNVPGAPARLRLTGDDSAPKPLPFQSNNAPSSSIDDDEDEPSPSPAQSRRLSREEIDMLLQCPGEPGPLPGPLPGGHPGGPPASHAAGGER